MKYLGLTLLAFAFAACNNTTSTGQDMMAGQDMHAAADLATPTGDLSAAPDLYYGGPATDGGPLMCGPSTCNPGEVCCVTPGAGGSTTATCATSCADGGIAIACNGPGQCGGDPCCATLSGGAPSDVMCTSAPSDCEPTFNIATKSGMTRLCNVDGDCTAGLPNPPQTYMFNTCCHNPSNPNTHFCFSKTYAALSQGQVVCP